MDFYTISVAEIYEFAIKHEIKDYNINYIKLRYNEELNNKTAINKLSDDIFCHLIIPYLSNKEYMNLTSCNRYLHSCRNLLSLNKFFL